MTTIESNLRVSTSVSRILPNPISEISPDRTDRFSKLKEIQTGWCQSLSFLGSSRS